MGVALTSWSTSGTQQKYTLASPYCVSTHIMEDDNTTL